eukprot:GEZU01027142.1.p1 GENE.GEZU01027142.1~~GEZU01027142.1.p1  ORF type:complete len:157 (+),score=24.32 GEZU01027142.1:362-832(+)
MVSPTEPGGDTEGENSNSSGSPPKASSSSSSSNSNKAMSKTNLVTGYNKETLSWVTQHVLFPCCRLFFAPPKRFATDGTVVQVACVENLYKIFERFVAVVVVLVVFPISCSLIPFISFSTTQQVLERERESEIHVESQCKRQHNEKINGLLVFAPI